MRITLELLMMIYPQQIHRSTTNYELRITNYIHSHHHFCSLSWLALNCQLSPDVFNPFLYPQKTKAIDIRNTTNFKPLSIILDPQDALPLFVHQFNLDFPSFGVLESIG